MLLKYLCTKLPDTLSSNVFKAAIYQGVENNHWHLLSAPLRGKIRNAVDIRQYVIASCQDGFHSTYELIEVYLVLYQLK